MSCNIVFPCFLFQFVTMNALLVDDGEKKVQPPSLSINISFFHFYCRGSFEKELESQRTRLHAFERIAATED